MLELRSENFGKPMMRIQ